MEKIVDLPALLEPLVERVSAECRALFIASLEENASRRYAMWASQADDPGLAEGLSACSERESRIAILVNSLYSDAEVSLDQDLLKEAGRIAAEAFEGQGLRNQFAMQAAAERSGAEAWRRLAKAAKTLEEKDVFLKCARLEEKSAEFLEEYLKDRQAGFGESYE